MLCRSSEEFQKLEREEPDSTSDEVHLLLLDQAAASAEKRDKKAMEKQTFTSVYDNSVKSSGIENRLLSQLDHIALSPHLCQENNSAANAFGLRDLHHTPPPPGFTHHTTGEPRDTSREFLNVRPSSGLSFFPQGIHCYGSPFQHDTSSLPFHSAYYSTTTPHGDTSYTDQNHSTLFPLSSVGENAHQPPSDTIPAVTPNKLQAAVQSGVGSTKLYEHFASPKKTDSMKEERSTPACRADGNTLGSRHQLLFNDVSATPLASVYDKDVPDDASYASSAGTIGETKPIGFVPAIKGTTPRSEGDAGTEVDDVGQLGHDIDARLTTTARVQPSSKPPSQQQAAAAAGNTKPEASDSDAHDPQTADECKSAAKGAIRPALMPGYPGPMPWPVPPYHGGPFPYPFYPPWAYCPPVPMMPMMPHPMMQMVPMPCWMPPMHPAMRMRLPMAPPSAVDGTEKPEVASETKP